MAQNYLQGALEKPARGPAHLRYCDPSEWDVWGGKVCLDDDPRLAPWQDGDLLFVEGEIVYENGQPQFGPDLYPRYRIRTVRRADPR